MKVVLVHPPIEDFYITNIRRQPLGLLYIASALKEKGHEVMLLNCHLAKKKEMPIPDEFDYLKKFMLQSDPYLKFPFKSYSHWGLSWEEISLRIKNIEADLWFISSLFTTYYEEVDRIIELIKKHHKNSIIAVGGNHATLHAQYYLNAQSVDFIIRGEGEISSIELLEKIQKGGALDDIPGVIYTKNPQNINSLSQSPDINQIAYPARELLAPRDFIAYKKKLISLITSRGCPNRCNFCTGKIIWGNKYRTTNIDYAMKEIDQCLKDYKADIINFEDDNLFANQERAKSLLNEIIKLKKTIQKNFELTAMNGISIENINEEILPLMQEAGFKELNISLVTKSSAIQSENNRPFDSQKFKNIASAAQNLGFNVRGYFIMGLPEQTKEEIRETIDFLKSLKISFFPSVYYNVFSPESQWKVQRSSAFYNEGKDFTREDLIKFFKVMSHRVCKNA